MIRLKVGENYMWVSAEDQNHKDFISYMMGGFRGSGKVTFALDIESIINYHRRAGFISMERDVVCRVIDKALDNLTKVTDKSFYILLKIPIKSKDRFTSLAQEIIAKFKQTSPDVKIKVITINPHLRTGMHEFCINLLGSLKEDGRSIYSHIDCLEDYKRFSARMKTIPQELKVIDANMKSLAKQSEGVKSQLSIKELESLDFIENADFNGTDLILDIKPINIYPSGPLGTFFNVRDFERNSYLAKACEEIYKGGHFRAPASIVKINSNFMPTFVETVDSRFDDLMRCTNWSSVGYPHFGKGHFCGGEFNSVIEGAIRGGLYYYFTAFKMYLGTANIGDYAGYRVVWYPIYNDEGEMVYCGWLDRIRDLAKEGRLTNDPNTKEMVINCSWEELADWVYRNRNSLSFDSSLFCSTSASSFKEDNYLLYRKSKGLEPLDI